MGFLLENITNWESFEVGAGASSVLPLGGFVKGDPIVKTTYKACREATGATQTVSGFCQNSVVYPYTNKKVDCATDGLVEVTAAGVIALDGWCGLDSTDKRKLVALTIDGAGTTLRQAWKAASPAAADGDKFIIDLKSEQLITI